jgi:hypothetical protein
MDVGCRRKVIAKNDNFVYTTNTFLRAEMSRQRYSPWRDAIMQNALELQNVVEPQVAVALSNHAVTRMAQRNLSAEDVEYVIQFGCRVWSGGALHYFLRYNDIPKVDRKRVQRLEGTTVLMDRSGQYIITVYRNRRGLKGIRQKVKREIGHRTLH